MRGQNTLVAMAEISIEPVKSLLERPVRTMMQPWGRLRARIV